jgi:uncharacterized protein YbaA (DUF1428 family)
VRCDLVGGHRIEQRLVSALRGQGGPRRHVPRGEVTDFFRATQAKDDETVIFSWIEYPDKATRDAANEKMSADSEAMEMEMPFDSRRMFWGGFEQVLDQ